jgi:hypothetical protein
MTQTNPTIFTELRATSLNINGVDVVTALLLASGQVVDLNGEADALIFDAAQNVRMDGSTAGHLKIKISGAYDFDITANTLTALSGSTIATNTIAETTAASGVTIDSVLLKDGSSKHLVPVVAVSADGAISVPAGGTDYFITKAGVAAMTLVDPTATTHDGLHLLFIATTANAHTLDNSAGSGFFSSGGSSKDIATFGGTIGDRIEIVAYQGKWYIVDSLNITLG